jgi:preprotein translocase subunit YajC
VRIVLATMIYQSAGGAAAGDPTTSLILNLLPMIGIIAIFYFLLIRPQNKRAKAHRDMLGALKKGDTVVTTGGVIGKIVRLSDDEAQIDVGEGVKLRLMRHTILDLYKKGETPANDVAAKD